jgi:FkbM family methyltransferase
VTVIRRLRRLRHGPLKGLAPGWTAMGRLYRWAVRPFEGRGDANMRIGPFGPFRLNPRFAFSNFEEWGQQHNAGFKACIEACRGAHAVLDIGAHIGLVTIPAASVIAAGGKVYAFEPSAANGRTLRDHLRRNGLSNVEVIDALAGDSDRDEVPFFERAEDSGMNSVVLRKEPEAYVETRKRQIAIDSFCTERNISPEVIKIDVEGYEIEVLNGARRTICNARPHIFLSVHPQELRLLDHSLKELRSLIDKLGYRIHTPEGVEPEELALAEYLLTPAQGKTGK